MQSKTFKVVRDVVELFAIPHTAYRQSQVIAKDELVQLEEFLKLILPVFHSETCSADRLHACSEHIARYVLGGSEPVAGSTYKALRHLVRRLGDCGLFESFCGYAFPGRSNKELDHRDEIPVESSQKKSEPTSSLLVNGFQTMKHSHATRNHYNPRRSLPTGERTAVQQSCNKCVCALCTKGFSTSGNLRRHVILHHDTVRKSATARSDSRQKFERLRHRFVSLRCCKGSRNSLQAHRALCNRSLNSHVSKILYQDRDIHDCDRTAVERLPSGGLPILAINQAAKRTVTNGLVVNAKFVRSKRKIRRQFGPGSAASTGCGVVHKLSVGVLTAEVGNAVIKEIVQREAGGMSEVTTKKHRCPECGKSLATRSNLERHYRLHIGDRPFECEICGTEFSDVSNLRKHEQVHLAKKSSNDHKVTAATSLNGFTCNAYDCGIGGNDDDSTCSPCNADSDKSSPENSDSVELGRKAKGQPAEFPCFICAKVFPYRSHLYEHIKVHTNDRPYQCEVCGKAFKRTGDLTTHARFHDAEKQFECADCGQRFRWKNGLDRHRRIHTGERPFLCTVCGRAFADWGSHKQHVRSHTIGAGVQPERFPCKICGKTFAWKRGLARHVRSHAAGKPGMGF